jgi:hypothetical protein
MPLLNRVLRRKAIAGLTFAVASVVATSAASRPMRWLQWHLRPQPLNRSTRRSPRAEF